ncbi:MAG TPA: hypothetical protein VII53_10450 [Solirubrobacteraceae bacterium]
MEDQITRDRHAITEDIGEVHATVLHLDYLLTNGETAEQIGDVPSALKQVAEKLSGLADELAAVWPVGSV